MSKQLTFSGSVRELSEFLDDLTRERESDFPYVAIVHFDGSVNIVKLSDLHSKITADMLAFGSPEELEDFITEW